MRENRKAGFVIGRSYGAKVRKTFIVLGAPRGGTSLVAAALILAGVKMGEDISPGNNEDRAFNFHNGNLSLLTSGPAREGYLARIRNIIRARNKRYSTWGWKDPLAALYVEDILGDLVNPQFILITRDITAAVMRECIELEGSIKSADARSLYFAKAGQALRLYHSGVAVAQKTGAPTLFVSYDKACRNPEDFANQLMRFVSGRSENSHKENASIEAIKLLTREGATSANLANRTITIADAPLKGVDFNSFPDLPTLYHRCATLINMKQYQEGLVLARSALAQAALGFEAFPRLQNNPIVIAEVEAGMWFMAAIAHINLGDSEQGYLALSRFSAMAKYLRLTGQNSEVVAGLTGEATRLLRQLERDLGR